MPRELNFVALHTAKLEPSFRAYLPGVGDFRSAAEQRLEGDTLGIEIVFWEPPAGHQASLSSVAVRLTLNSSAISRTAESTSRFIFTMRGRNMKSGSSRSEANWSAWFSGSSGPRAGWLSPVHSTPSAGRRIAGLRS
jgi:hypothetical protein